MRAKLSGKRNEGKKKAITLGNGLMSYPVL